MIAGIRTRVLDRQAIKFEAMVYRVGHGDATKAFSRALNHEGKKGHTLIKRELRVATSIKAGDIGKGVKFLNSSPKSLIPNCLNIIIALPVGG